MSPMNISETRENVIRVLATLSGVPAEKIKPTDRLGEDLALDSLKRMEALSRISDQYGLDPDLERVMDLRTVGEVLALMEQGPPASPPASNR